jgi:hypothetical protein
VFDSKLCYRRSVCTYISIPTIYMYKVESIECLAFLPKSYNIGASLLYLRFNVCLNGYHKRNQLTREKEIYIPSLYIHSRPVMCIHYSLLSVMAEKNDSFIHFFLHRVSIVCKYVLSFDTSGHALGIWIRGCSLFYKRELWASKSAGAHSTESLKIKVIFFHQCSDQ